VIILRMRDVCALCLKKRHVLCQVLSMAGLGVIARTKAGFLPYGFFGSMEKNYFRLP